MRVNRCDSRCGYALSRLSFTLMIRLTIKNKRKGNIYEVITPVEKLKKERKKEKLVYEIKPYKFVPPDPPSERCSVCNDPVYFYELPSLCLYCEKLNDAEGVFNSPESG